MSDPFRQRSDRSSREASAGRHAGGPVQPAFDGTFAALGELAYDGAQVSATVIDLESGRPLVSIDDRVVLPVAGIGTALLLIEVSARLTARDDSGFGILDKPIDRVVGAGLWRHMQAPALPVIDLAVLVGATGDLLATNQLIERVGLAAVRTRVEALGLKRTALLDIARDVRGPDDAPQFAVGSTAELAHLFSLLARDEVVDVPTSRRVKAWLSLGSDLSMVASAFGLAPQGHRGPDHGLRLVNATGTDAGLRTEAGILRGRRAAVAYAVTVRFDDDALERRLGVLDAMHTVGRELLDHVH
jgi:beta-lactamase class A